MGALARLLFQDVPILVVLCTRQVRPHSEQCCFWLMASLMWVLNIDFMCVVHLQKAEQYNGGSWEQGG
eukprot:1374825-Amphidinium_carterae.1